MQLNKALLYLIFEENKCFSFFREDTFALKKGELEKKKSYSALCWCEKVLNKETFESIVSGIKVSGGLI